MNDFTLRACSQKITELPVVDLAPREAFVDDRASPGAFDDEVLVRVVALLDRGGRLA